MKAVTCILSTSSISYWRFLPAHLLDYQVPGLPGLAPSSGEEPRGWVGSGRDPRFSSNTGSSLAQGPARGCTRLLASRSWALLECSAVSRFMAEVKGWGTNLYREESQPLAVPALCCGHLLFDVMCVRLRGQTCRLLPWENLMPGPVLQALPPD